MILLFNFCINLNLLFQEIIAQEDKVKNNYCLFQNLLSLFIWTINLFLLDK